MVCPQNETAVLTGSREARYVPLLDRGTQLYTLFMKKHGGGGGGGGGGEEGTSVVVVVVGGGGGGGGGGVSSL